MYTFNEKEHLHSLDGQPLYGTSTVIKDVMPPFLAKWGATCAVDHIKAKSEEAVPGLWYVSADNLEKAILAWSKVRKEAADKGTDMHAELEDYVGDCILGEEGKPYLLEKELIEKGETHKAVIEFSEWAVASVNKFIGSEVYTYSKELWVGGIVDCVAEMRDGSLAVIDFKSSKEAYFNQFAQTAGYAAQLMESGYGDKDGSNWQKLPAPITKLIIIPFGAKTFKPEIIENVEGYVSVFKSLVNVYTYLNSFNKK